MNRIQQESIPVGCILTADVVSIPYPAYPTPDKTYPLDILPPRYPTPLKGPGTTNTQLHPDTLPQIPCPSSYPTFGIPYPPDTLHHGYPTPWK